MPLPNPIDDATPEPARQRGLFAKVNPAATIWSAMLSAIALAVVAGGGWLLLSHASGGYGYGSLAATLAIAATLGALFEWQSPQPARRLFRFRKRGR